VGTLQLTAIAACSAPDAVAAAAAGAQQMAELRAQMVAGLHAVGAQVVGGRAPFVLFTVGDGMLVRKRLYAKGIVVRRADTFVGLDGRYLRAAVRPEWPVLVQAIAEAAA
jgi:histidinol-phosphate aminotransferase